MKNFKNLLCILLVMTMFFSAVCMNVSATENNGETINTESIGQSQPDCDSKPVTQETTNPTDEPSETNTPPVTLPDPTATLTAPVTTEPQTESTEITVSTEPSTQTEPSETTEPVETTKPTETEETKSTEPTEPTEPDTTPRLNKKKLKLEAGETFNLKVKYSKGARARYSSDNTKVAIVSSSGKVTALKKGTAKITVRMNDKKFICKVTVLTNPKLKKSGKTITEIILAVGEKAKVNLVGKADLISNVYYNSPVAMFSSKPTTEKLTVKALKAGTATIKVKVNNTKIIKLKVTVK